MAESLERRLVALEYTPPQTRTLTDAERAVRLYWRLGRGWNPPQWLRKLITADDGHNVRNEGGQT